MLDPEQMAESDSRFVDSLIETATITVGVYLGATCVLGAAALTVFAYMIIHPIQNGATEYLQFVTGVIGLFSLLPIPLCINSVLQRASFRYMKDQYEDAVKNNNLVEIEKVRGRITAYSDSIMQKGWGLAPLKP
jgi:cadmium resistance protein CadD (predicted permease)